MKIINNSIKSKFKFNKIILYLTASDIFTWGLMVVISSFTGLYLAEKLNMPETEVVKFIGVGIALNSFTNGLLQIPLGYLIDKIKGDLDEIWILFFANTIMGIPLLFFPLISSVELYYIFQVIMGVGTAANLITWRKLFAKHVDKDHEGMEYGSYETVMSLSIGIFSIISGSLASVSGEYFDIVMVGMGIIMILSSIWAYMIFRYEYKGSFRSETDQPLIGVEK